MSFPNLDLLAGEAFGWVAQRSRLRPAPSWADPAEKYVVRSSLQKAVRRGRAQAVDLALTLHRIEPAYTWRAILTIALEDVGFGCPDAVLWATAAQSIGFRRQVGELPLLIALTLEMTRSLKSRAACELSYSVDTGQLDAFRYVGRLTTPQLLAFVQARDPHETYMALSILRGVVPSGHRVRAHDPHGVMAACEIIHDQLPPALARAASAALVRPLDNLSLGTFPAWRAAHDEGEAEIIEDIMPESRRLGRYSSETYDQHERLGRQAIRLFTRSLRLEFPAIRALTLPNANALIGDALFVEEGQCMDRWAAGGVLTRLRAESDGFTLAGYEVRDAEADEVRQVVREAIPRLNDIRADLVERAQAGGIR